MAAKPIERFVKKQIQEQGGWPRILERIASGETVADVARTMARPDGQPISRAFFSRLLHLDPERSQAVLKAREEGADAMVDDGLHLVDSALPERDAIQKARVQADMRLKVAGLVSRERWGERGATINVGLNVASLHVDALRQRTVTSGDSTWGSEVGGSVASQARGTPLSQQETVQSAMQDVALPTPSPQSDPSLT